MEKNVCWTFRRNIQIKILNNFAGQINWEKIYPIIEHKDKKAV